MTTHQQRKLTDSWLPQPAHEEIQRPPLKPSIGAVRDGLRESLGLQPSMFDELETAPDPAGLIVASVGYRGWGDPAGLFAALVADGVRIVVDVRWMPWGRNRAYAPKRLQAAGRLAGVEYQHLRSLGNRAYKEGRIELADPAKGLRLLELNLATHRRVALMCACRELAGCHVERVLELLTERVEFEHRRIG